MNQKKFQIENLLPNKLEGEIKKQLEYEATLNFFFLTGFNKDLLLFL